MKNVLSRLETAFAAAAITLLTACGGGGGGGGVTQSAGGAIPPTSPATSAPLPVGGPVGYLQSIGPNTSSGSISQGSSQAVVAVMSGSSSTDKVFASDTLSVSTGAGASSIARRVPQSSRRALTSPVVPVEAFPADDSALISKLSRIAVPAGGAHVESQSRRTQSTIPPNAVVGSTASIWVSQGGPGGSQSIQVASTLIAQSAHGNIWLDNSLLGTAAASNASVIAQDFENAYASDTAHFASPDYASNAPGLQAQYENCNSSGQQTGAGPGYIQEPADRRVNVMIVNPADLGGYGGYFSASNLMQQSALNCLNANGSNYQSNEAPFIYVGWFSYESTDYELHEDLVRGTAHELQHLINFVNHAIVAPGASSPSFSGIESTYINEGLSMLAQDLAVDHMYGAQGVHFDADDALARADAYLAAPGNYSVSGFIGIDGGGYGGYGSPEYNCFGGCYGSAYLFQRYLRDRFGGDAFTHAMESSGQVGSANLQSITGESAAALLDDFALAMAADTLGVSASNSRFAFGTLDLTQSYPDQFGQVKKLGGLFASPLSGSSASVTAPVGGFTFVSVGSVPANGLGVTVTDRQSASGFGLTGGLAQH